MQKISGQLIIFTTDQFTGGISGVSVDLHVSGVTLATHLAIVVSGVSTVGVFGTFAVSGQLAHFAQAGHLLCKKKKTFISQLIENG